MSDGIVINYIRDDSDKTITGVWVFNRTAGGVLSAPAGSSFPTTPVAGEWFWRTDQGILYRRNDANTAWDGISVSASTIDHGQLLPSSLGDDDHPQYHDGSLPYTGNLDMGGFQITNVGNVDGRDVSVDGTNLDNHISSTANPHSTSLANIGSGTLADLNSKVTDATLDDISGARTPTTHSGSHITGGSDELDGDQVDIDFTPSNYTPSTAPVEVTNVDHLSAHLAGIDSALAPISEKFFASSTGISTTTLTTFQTKVSLGPNTYSGGLYKLTVSYGWNHNALNSDFEARILFDGSQLGELHKQEPKDAAGADSTGTTQRYYVTRTGVLNIGAGNHTIALEYRTDDSAAESSIWEAYIMIEKWS